MKKIILFSGILLTIIVACTYIISLLTAYISPARFTWLSIVSVAYLPMLCIYMVVMGGWLFTDRKIFLLLLLLFLAGYKNLFATVGLNFFSPGWNWQKEPGDIRVMTWNVSSFGDPYRENDSANSPRRQMLALIRKVQPDILCVQDFRVNEEVSPRASFVNNLQDIMKAGEFAEVYYPFYYSYNGPVYCDQTGCAIFSRWPVINKNAVRTSGYSEERAAYVDIMTDKKPLRIYTAHLASMSLWPNTNNEAGIGYLEGDSTRIKARTIYAKLRGFGAIHAAEAGVLKSFMDSAPHPVIFTGDLNSVPSGYVYHRLAKGLQDAFLEKDFGIGGTYNRVFPKLRIDVLFHSKELRVKQYHRLVTNLSDHYPLLADIGWNE